jgi:hypothetical protein
MAYVGTQQIEEIERQLIRRGNIVGGGGGPVAWLDVTGKPSTFPPEAHNQAISTITGLQTALDGKAALSHSHIIADVTGLQAALDGKQAAGSYAAASHTHTSSEITDLGVGFIVENRTSDPGSPVTGQIWIRTDL